MLVYEAVRLREVRLPRAYFIDNKITKLPVFNVSVSAQSTHRQYLYIFSVAAELRSSILAQAAGWERHRLGPVGLSDPRYDPLGYYLVQVPAPPPRTVCSLCGLATLPLTGIPRASLFHLVQSSVLQTRGQSPPPSHICPGSPGTCLRTFVSYSGPNKMLHTGRPGRTDTVLQVLWRLEV